MTKQNEYNVITSERARQILVSHAVFLAQASVEAAERLVVTYENAADSLEKMPHRCLWFNEEYIPQNKYRFLTFEKRYMLIFQIKDYNVYVDYVLDCRQDYSWLIRD